jgi:hypothetical protein
MTAYGYILGDGIFEPGATDADYMIDAFERTLRRFRRQGGSGGGLADRLEVQARERYALPGHSAGPVLCHDDFQPANVCWRHGTRLVSWCSPA